MTIEEIAKQAKVSKATVSMVVNGKKGVGIETRQRVQQIIAASGYNVRSRRKGRLQQGNIRFVKYKKQGSLVERNGDFISRVLDGVESGARNEKMNLKITNVTSENLKEQIEAINLENDDGIIFLGTEFLAADAEILNRFQAPVVVVDNEMRNCNVNSVVMNNEEAVYMAVKYLYSMGHRRIGYIYGGDLTDNFISRTWGYKKAMEVLGLKPKAADIYLTVPEINESYTILLDKFKTAKSFPTAFFAGNDVLAISCLRALQECGIKVPQDVSVIGMDDLMMSAVSSPELTTMKIHKKAMGELSVSRLVEIIKHGNKDIVKHLVSADIVERKSVQDLAEEDMEYEKAD